VTDMLEAHPDPSSLELDLSFISPLVPFLYSLQHVGHYKYRKQNDIERELIQQTMPE
jgi:hypothetical protein